jgi:hypothetical protein
MKEPSELGAHEAKGCPAGYNNEDSSAEIAEKGTRVSDTSKSA